MKDLIPSECGWNYLSKDIYKKVFNLYWLTSLSKQASQCTSDTRRKSRQEKEEWGMRMVGWEWQTLKLKGAVLYICNFVDDSEFKIFTCGCWCWILCKGKRKHKYTCLYPTAQIFIQSFTFWIVAVEAEIFQCVWAANKLVFIVADKGNNFVVW